MATRREYLAGLTPPLAKLGRGRLSREALAEIAKAHERGVVFDDDAGQVVVRTEKPTVKPKPEQVKARPLGMEAPRNKQIRNLTETPYGYTPEGFKVEFIICAQCHYHVNLCDCKGGPRAPKMIVRLPPGSPCVLYS